MAAGHAVALHHHGIEIPMAEQQGLGRLCQCLQVEAEPGAVRLGRAQLLKHGSRAGLAARMGQCRGGTLQSQAQPRGMAEAVARAVASGRSALPSVAATAAGRVPRRMPYGCRAIHEPLRRLQVGIPAGQNRLGSRRLCRAEPRWCDRAAKAWWAETTAPGPPQVRRTQQAPTGRYGALRSQPWT